MSISNESGQPEFPEKSAQPVSSQSGKGVSRRETGLPRSDHKLGWMFRGLFALSLAFNLLIISLLAVILAVVLFLFVGGRNDENNLRERFYSGSRSANDKIAIIHIDGVIMEGMTSFARKQIEEAASDDQVKAVVVRINSPGGTITASDDLHRRLSELRDGNAEKKTSGKPLVVSMGSLAASGGYYIAMPAKHIVAERTTITGSIGVYAAFPNIAGLADKYGVKMNVIKRGDVKDSGSMFHEMTPQEHQLWQDMVDHAYQEFLDIVNDGRGNKLKYPLEAEIKEEKKNVAGKDKTGRDLQVSYTRRLADGGIFTADKALKYGLVDEVGYLSDAVTAARKTAALGEKYQAITYDRPSSIINMILGAEAKDTIKPLNLGNFSRATMPRVWYLASQSWWSGVFAAGSQE